MDQDLYIGYAATASPRIIRWIKPVITSLFAAGLLVAFTLTSAQQQFDDSRFEFSHYRTYTGQLHLTPYPTLRTLQGDYILVAPGKHGATPMVNRFAEQTVKLWGALIEHDSDRMLELDTRPIEITGTPQPLPPVLEDRFATVEMAGEIVDSKCYLGVMNPGRGKVHRDCAARCISGGIPPALLVRDAGGKPRLFLLLDRKDENPGRRLLPLVGEPIRVRGAISRKGGNWILRADPESFTRE